MGIYIAVGACLFVGSVIILFVVKSFIETVVFIRAAVKTTGKVIRLDNSRNSDGQRMYLPVFQYRTNDGSVYQYTSTVASSPPAYNVGDTATLLYLKRNPQNARLKSFVELWLFKTIFAVIGCGCYVAALFIFLSAK